MSSEAPAMEAKGNPIPGASAVTTIVVCKDVPSSLTWYKDVMGADVFRSYGTSVVLNWLGAWFLLVEGGAPTPDKPDTTLAPPEIAEGKDDVVNVMWTIRVEDCQAAYDELLKRGAKFLTPPVRNGAEVRVFTRDPSGHLYELSSVDSS